MPRDIRSRRSSAEELQDRPLDVEEQEELDEFLRLGCADGDLLNFMALDGFLTALVLVPGPQMPASWHGPIFGGRDEADLLERLAVAEERGILALLLRHWRTVRRRAFATGQWRLPEGWEDTWLRATDWAIGFLDGMLRTDEEWEGRITRARCDELLKPVRRIAELPLTAPPAPGTILPALSEEERAALDEELVGAVREFYREFRGRG